MTPLEYLTLAAVCLAGAASPGPSLAVVLGASLNGSRAAGLAAAWAHALGVALYAGLTVLGISAIIATSTPLYSGIQIAGAAYLLYLAIRLWRNASTSNLEAATAAQSPARAAVAGFSIAFLNPKLAVFMLALFSQFVRPGATLGQQFELVAIAGLIDGAWYSLVTFALTTERWVGALRRQSQRIDRVLAILLAGVGIAIFTRSVSVLIA